MPQCPLDSEGSDGEVEDSVAGDEEVHVEDEEEEREVVGGIPEDQSHLPGRHIATRLRGSGASQCAPEFLLGQVGQIACP